MKKSISAILCLSVIAVLAGCNADPAETSVSVPTASFDPSNFETTEATQITYPYSSDFSLPTNGDPCTNEELLDLAKKRFKNMYGFEPHVENVYENDNTIYIHIFEYYSYDENSDSIDIESYDVYFINKKTGAGTDSNGNPVDLTAYI